MWRIDRTADYGAFQDAARSRVDLARIARHWEDILRITGAVRAYDVIRMLSRDGRPTPLGDAIAHCGRIAKTLHILHLADEPGCRRQIKVQAHLHEGRHALARKIFHGRAGQPCQRYQGGMEDQIGALGLDRRCEESQNVVLAAAPSADGGQVAWTHRPPHRGPR
ncbi:hypothetical protein GCM10010216_20680 [Streptomyces flaveolus]|nr:transposase [Streptomyces flaveolus]GGQ58607.1 hypothetical protein GCM10010216_20680 [Streptomyces flaveolus]